MYRRGGHNVGRFGGRGRGGFYRGGSSRNILKNTTIL